jgi:cystathionine beta-synthase
MKIMNSIAEAVGNTPLIKLSRMQGISPQHTLLAKCEFLNPGGSVKDRIAFRMVEKAEEKGDLRPGMLIVEATGGNTGIGLALAARLKNYQLLCVMTEKVGKEKVRLMQILGAEVMVLPGGKAITDANHFINQARRIARERNGWFVGQFENEENIAAHYETTGPEIWEQTDGKVDAIVAGIGTGGTIFGAGKYLKEKKPAVKLVLADPEGSCLADWVAKREPQPGTYLVEGIGGDFIPSLVDLSKIDCAIKINDKDSVRTAHELLNKEALFVGGSAGLIVAAAIEYVKQAPEEALTVVAVLPSTGRLYTNTIFDEEWLNERLPTSAGPGRSESRI